MGAESVYMLEEHVRDIVRERTSPAAREAQTDRTRRSLPQIRLALSSPARRRRLPFGRPIAALRLWWN